MPRAIPFTFLLPEDVAAYIASIPGGQKGKTIVADIRASDGFKRFDDEEEK